MKHKWILTTTLLGLGTVFADVSSVESEQNVAVEKKAIAPQYDHRIGFFPERLVYERTKVDSLYMGLDAWWNLYREKDVISEAEARLGYNFCFNGRDYFTPVVGAGYLFDQIKPFSNAKFIYGTLGFQYQHKFNTVFGLGVKLKGLAGQQIGKSEPKKFAWGADLALPITFRFGHYRHWDFTSEPYCLYMQSDQKGQYVFGGRATLGYRF